MPVPAIFDRLRLPVIGAPLFIVSNPDLVIAQCKAGIVGSFPALNARPASQLDEWIHEITEALAAHDRDHPDRPAAPFAVNQIVHATNTRFEADMALKETLYGERYPLDEDFLAALAHMPNASGVALGFDRLVMLATGASRIDQVIWTPFR